MPVLTLPDSPPLLLPPRKLNGVAGRANGVGVGDRVLTAALSAALIACRVGICAISGEVENDDVDEGDEGVSTVFLDDRKAGENRFSPSTLTLDRPRSSIEMNISFLLP